MISVCLTTCNGAQYVEAQLRSILRQLSEDDEVVVSDDGSVDGTLELVANLSDKRIRIINGPRRGVVANFECALRQASGDIIFLSDQDDIWLPGKVAAVLGAMDDADLVVTDCRVVDAALNVVHPSFFSFRGSRPGLMWNLLRNSYLGCCMALNRRVLQAALPFPRAVAMHDWWLGLIGECVGRVRFVDEALLLYRRHGENLSSTSERTAATLRRRLTWRLVLIWYLAGRCVSLILKKNVARP